MVLLTIVIGIFKFYQLQGNINRKYVSPLHLKGLELLSISTKDLIVASFFWMIFFQRTLKKPAIEFVEARWRLSFVMSEFRHHSDIVGTWLVLSNLESYGFLLATRLEFTSRFPELNHSWISLVGDCLSLYDFAFRDLLICFPAHLANSGGPFPGQSSPPFFAQSAYSAAKYQCLDTMRC